MKRSATIFLQVVVVLIGLGILTFMLWEPHLEGRNANSTVFQVYFADPFLAYIYIASIAFFVGVYQAFKLLGYVGRDEIFSVAGVKALRTIKYCALVFIAFILGAEVWIFIVQRGTGEDIAGGVMMGVFLVFVSAVVAAAAGVFERTLQTAVDLKSENDLTV